MQVIPGAGIIISVEYAHVSDTWARLYDSQLIGWNVDETGDAADPRPVIIGQLPLPAQPSTMLSPQWASFINPSVLVPDMLRGPLDDFLTWLATNSAGTRLLESRFRISTELYNGFNAWARLNPSLVVTP